jgi:hypothetical protein
MSLKAFHIIFVTVTTLFSLFFGMWSLDQYRNVDPSGQNLTFMLLSFAMLVVLPVYGYYFLKKLKDVSFL